MPPVFTDHPQGLMVRMGGTLRLAGRAAGTEPIAYVWQKDGMFLGFATNSALVITNTQPADSGSYALVASNGLGTARSDSAQVIIYTNQPCNFPWAWATKYRSTTPTCYSSVAGMARDSQENIYVTGPACMTGSDWNYVTLKLSPAGHVLWTASFDDPSHNGDTPRALALDSDGNCYVTGSTYTLDGHDDYLTVKYGLSGEQLWTARFNSTTNIIDANDSNDEAYALSVDSAGNVYVSGNRGILKYDRAGTLLWKNANGGTSLVLPPDGQAVYVGGGGSPSIAKLDLHGNTLWSEQIPNVEGLTVDTEGSPYVIARSNFNFAAGTGDIETIKFDPSGKRVWTAIYDGPARGIDSPTRLAVDSSNCVYVTGHSWTANRPPLNGSDRSALDILTLKYDPAGNDPAGKLVWAARFNGSGNGEDVSSDLAVDRDGAVYVCGVSEIDPAKPSGYREAVLIKYASDGNELWTSRFRSSPQRPIGSGYFGKLALDPSGRISVAGFAHFRYPADDGHAPAYTEFLIVHYDQQTPRLTVGEIVAPGVRQGSLVSPRGTRFEIQATTDFRTWEPVARIMNLNGLAPFFDRDAGAHPHRFYRALKASE